ncbi:hypothetical protein EKN06_14295 [Croceicoccus ponticola]|uniref:Uncharacterized protein n=1 Tax=Croceicoccus ponticola TaxID=2217664 RepID=A0A437GUJ9_9SPHN|nr:hypothetical protein [Croceicoccus ponticola]RVQ65168.1 hypothetical protein EKN06_14295 [Croceicoccus ponticola]
MKRGGNPAAGRCDVGKFRDQFACCLRASDLTEAKKLMGAEKGYRHYESMVGDELVYSPHTVLFPNVTISFMPDNILAYLSVQETRVRFFHERLNDYLSGLMT